MLEGSVKSIGEKHPITLVAYINVGASLVKQGKQEEALPLLKRVYEVRKESFGLKHADTLNILIDLADLLSKLGKSEQADSLIREGLQATSKESVDEEIRSRLVHLAINLQREKGRVHSEENDPFLESLLIEALAGMESRAGASAKELIPYLETLSSFYSKRNPSIVPTLLERVCEIHKHNGSPFEEKIDAYLKLADSFQKVDKEYAKAAPYLHIAVKLAENHHGPSHMQTISGKPKFFFVFLRLIFCSK